jgi:probable rRNA maturation factor
VSAKPVVSVQSEGVRSPVARQRLARAAELVLRAERTSTALLSVTLVSARGIAALNRRHLGHRGPTDVISFGFRDPQGAVIGDIYVCPEVAAQNAKAHGVGVREELVRLVVHGTLHVLGHDHPVGDARTRSPMWKRQERLVAKALRA